MVFPSVSWVSCWFHHGFFLPVLAAQMAQMAQVCSSKPGWPQRLRTRARPTSCCCGSARNVSRRRAWPGCWWKRPPGRNVVFFWMGFFFSELDGNYKWEWYGKIGLDPQKLWLNIRCLWDLYYLYGSESKPFNLSGMNIRLQAILGLTRCHGFDP